jgi:hypothetical protein
MCDYSLMGIRNRLAVEGGELVTCRFSTGSVGLAPWHKEMEQIQTRAHPGFWTVLWKVVWGPVRDSVPAVCVPPGNKGFADLAYPLIFQECPPNHGLAETGRMGQSERRSSRRHASHRPDGSAASRADACRGSRQNGQIGFDIFGRLQRTARQSGLYNPEWRQCLYRAVRARRHLIEYRSGLDSSRRHAALYPGEVQRPRPGPRWNG